MFLLSPVHWLVRNSLGKDKRQTTSGALFQPFNLQLWNVGAAIMLSGHHEMLGLTVFLTNYGNIMMRNFKYDGKPLLFVSNVQNIFKYAYFNCCFMRSGV